jgi:2-C-methyl-D-erythritol 2,4-cyclodiphosphate synthase
MRVGIGYDVHKLVRGRKLILGGVQIDFDKGLQGHSDADVLTHAVMDALLGAAGLRDIGIQFPSYDPKYDGISSLVLLEKVNKLLEHKGLDVLNIDAVIVAQKPELSPFIEDMRANISRRLKIDLDKVMVKATTTDGLGFIGAGEGIAACAVALVEEK